MNIRVSWMGKKRYKNLAAQFLSCRAVCVQKLDKHTLISLTIIELTIKYLISCLIFISDKHLLYLNISLFYLPVDKFLHNLQSQTNASTWKFSSNKNKRSEIIIIKKTQSYGIKCAWQLSLYYLFNKRV